MNPKTIFVDESNVLRSGWRVAIFILASFLASFLLMIFALSSLTAVHVKFETATVTSFVIQFIAFAVAALVVGWLCGKFLEQLPFSALGASFTGSWLRDLVVGLAVGGVTMCVAAGIVYAFGGFTTVMNGADLEAIGRTLATTLLLFICGAAFEEAFFRGYILQTLFRARHYAFGFIFTALLFASTHNANPGANPLSWFNTFLAGIWLAAAYLKTRNLWMAFGAHLAWNWIQGSVLGITVSGLEMLAPEPLMRTTAIGPEWLTGGAYGIEAGLACTIALIVSTIAIYFLPLGSPESRG